MSSTLADDIRTKLGDLSPAERKVARVLLAGYPSAVFETVATIAERAAVSAPTVLRFAARLGYRGFPELQAALRTELDARNASPLSLYEANDLAREDDPPSTNRPSLLIRTSTVLPAAVVQTCAEIPPHDFERAVALLTDHKRHITLVGGRFTHLLAQYLGLHLMQLRQDVRLLPDRPVERTAALAQLTKRDVVVLFDYRRYEDDKTAIARLVREAVGKVIVFTDPWLSPAAAHADVVLPSQVSTLSPYDSLVPSLAVVEALIAGVVDALGPQAHQRMRTYEEVARRSGLV
ncbi:MurR/RpiR family transcriptional regulator [Streptomyces candidus]|uniref:DNA-binding MurR/RpiR family transcriptional regulator n=1 Tax=Streptomyces candidus TaxID=67283 RepID=A0A7X0HED7_9ACTN|nr:MurR/RpiR family transcriptional regulator [Streptomyces candidus]MBB6435986.1 DNA-binding MurR/RpiR family transcriptional regulator [Streptomyces candidus]GHH43235.1 sugar isomerase [Streptomyces candidus]